MAQARRNRTSTPFDIHWFEASTKPRIPDLPTDEPRGVRHTSTAQLRSSLPTLRNYEESVKSINRTIASITVNFEGKNKEKREQARKFLRDLCLVPS